MKRILGLATLFMLFSIPAHAQFGTNTSIWSPVVANASNGVSIAGGLGRVTFPYLTNTPMPNFAGIALRGTEADFVISTFVPFKEAYAQGQAVLDAPPAKSIAEVAEENINMPRMKARYIFMQDANGNAIIWQL